jgi:hypothetical protein
MAPHPISLGSILVLSSHLYVGIPGGLFPSGYHTRTLYTGFIPLLSMYAEHTIDLIVLD